MLGARLYGMVKRYALWRRGAVGARQWRHGLVSLTHTDPGRVWCFLFIYIFLSLYNILNFPARRGAHTMGHTRDTRHTHTRRSRRALLEQLFKNLLRHDLNRTHLTPITPTRVTGAGGGAKSLITRRRPISHLTHANNRGGLSLARETVIRNSGKLLDDVHVVPRTNKEHMRMHAETYAPVGSCVQRGTHRTAK